MNPQKGSVFHFNAPPPDPKRARGGCYISLHNIRGRAFMHHDDLLNGDAFFKKYPSTPINHTGFMVSRGIHLMK